MPEADAWNPDQYNKFREQRKQPFYDLLALIRPRASMRVIDLGCGAGELTAELAERLPDAHVEGIDSSPAMLAEATPRSHDRLRFRQAAVEEVSDFGGYDLVFSNAMFQWAPDNEGLMQRILSQLRPGAQIAVQLPKNQDHPSHRLAAELAAESPFRELLGGHIRISHALSLERYAELLYDHGLREQRCFEQIYGHELPHTGDVVEWVKGTLLTGYLTRLDEETGAAFLAAYRASLLAELGDRAPYFYPFRRLLFWGERAA